MAVELILDTGPLVAILDRSQEHHEKCLSVFRSLSGELVTTEAVITESSHLLSRVPGGAALCVDFILKGGAILIPASDSSLRRACDLLRKYADTPMDYADATLVTLAEELRLPKVFTLDRRGFSSYRLWGRRSFEIIPGP